MTCILLNYILTVSDANIIPDVSRRELRQVCVCVRVRASHSNINGGGSDGRGSDGGGTSDTYTQPSSPIPLSALLLLLLLLLRWVFVIRSISARRAPSNNTHLVRQPIA